MAVTKFACLLFAALAGAAAVTGGGPAAGAARRESAGLSRETAGLRLRLAAASTTIRAGGQPDISVEIVNDGREAALLVAPGDGSARGLRSPLVKWIVEPVPGEGAADGVFRTVMACDNINPVGPDQVFELKPGESRRIAGWDGSQFGKPGKYLLRYEYENRPAMEWKGIPLGGGHDPATMARVRRSLACRLVSDDLILTVGE